MATHEIMGAVVLATAVIDAVVGQLIVVPRIADENKRKVAKAALAGSSLMLLLLGLAFYFDAMP